MHGDLIIGYPRPNSLYLRGLYGLGMHFFLRVCLGWLSGTEGGLRAEKALVFGAKTINPSRIYGGFRVKGLGWALPPLSNSWIILIIWLYIALNK